MNTDDRSPLDGGDIDHKRKRSRYSVLTYRVVTAIVVILVLSALFAIIGCTIAFRYYDQYAACYSILRSSGPTIDAHTRSGANSILYTTRALACSEKPTTTTEVILNDKTASVDLYQSPCEDIEKMPINDGYSWNNTRIGSKPVPIFSEDFSSHQNYFISGSIRVDTINITMASTDSSPTDTAEVCLYTDIDDFHKFVAGSTNWRNHAKCHAVQAKTELSDNSSITFNLSEPTFAFVGIAAMSSITLNIGKLTVTTNGVGLSGPGRNWTKKCQLDSKHNTCKFSLINNSREEICLIAHEEEHSDGSYSYSDLKIRLRRQINFRFWICIAVLILIMLICICIIILFIVTVLIMRARRKKRLKKLAFEEAVLETGGDQSDMSHSVNSDRIPSNSPTSYGNSEQDSRSSENHSRNLFDSPDPVENPDPSGEFVVPKL